MNPKTIGTIFLVVAFLAVVGALGYKVIQSTETYKAKEQTYHTNEPHFGFMSFGCASYKVAQAELEREKTQPVKK